MLTFFTLKNQYISILKSHHVNKNEINENNIKSLILKNVQTIVHRSKDDFSLQFNKVELLKALVGDIELLFNKATIQFANCIKLSHTNVNTSWKFVTYYYLGFFSLQTFLRQIHGGCIYIDSEFAKGMQNYYSTILCSPVQINRGYYELNIEIHDTDATLVFKKCGKDIHENTWKLYYSRLKELSRIEDKTSTEYRYFLNYIQSYKNYSEIYPSKFRNMVNYNMKYGFRENINRDYGKMLNLKQIHDKNYYIEMFMKSSMKDFTEVLNWVVLVAVNLYVLITELYLNYSMEKKSSSLKWLQLHKNTFNDICIKLELPTESRKHMTKWFIDKQLS